MFVVNLAMSTVNVEMSTVYLVMFTENTITSTANKGLLEIVLYRKKLIISIVKLTIIDTLTSLYIKPTER